MASVDLERMAADALDRAATVLELDQEVDVYLTVGVGAANAAELVVGGRGVVIASSSRVSLARASWDRCLAKGQRPSARQRS